jgi:ABC-2 type transport system ATP-binding protein
MTAAIECRGLGRVYRGRQGDVEALRGLNLTIEPNQIYCLLGPNGAGKTTLIKILVTLLTPTSGEAYVSGLNVATEAARVRRTVGFVLGGDRGLYPRLSGRDNLLYFGALWGLSPSQADQRSYQLLERMGLASAAKRRVEEYSRGMKQRLHLARGLLTRPRVLFLDEPTIGLDPVGARELRALINGGLEFDCTILLTTHYLAEAEELCDRLAVINKGSLVFEGTSREIKERARQDDVIEIEGPALDAHCFDLVGRLPLVSSRALQQSDGSTRITLTSPNSAHLTQEVLRVVAAEKYELAGLSIRRPTLEDAYVSLLQESSRADAGHSQDVDFHTSTTP